MQLPSTCWSSPVLLFSYRPGRRSFFNSPTILVMLSKLFFIVALFLGLAFEVQAHAIINPALGVTGTPARANVKRPSTQNPCGAGVNVATALASSKAVTADATGKFTVTVQNFNGYAFTSLYTLSILLIFL